MKLKLSSASLAVFKMFAARPSDITVESGGAPSLIPVPCTFVEASSSDEDEFLEIFKPILEAGESYDYEVSDTDIIIKEWFHESKKVYKALLNDEIVGFYKIRTNFIGRGSHIANCSYIVKSSIKGVGSQMGKHSIQQCEDLGYSAIQFNRVVSTNTRAINLWKFLGFKIIGTTPEGFRRKDGTFVDTCIMHMSLVTRIRD